MENKICLCGVPGGEIDRSPRTPSNPWAAADLGTVSLLGGGPGEKKTSVTSTVYMSAANAAQTFTRDPGKVLQKT